MRCACFAAAVAVFAYVGVVRRGEQPRPAEVKRVPVLVAWHGEIGLDRKSDAPPRGYITDDETWKTLWESWRKDEPVPKVDFDNAIILVTAGRDPNLIRVHPTVDWTGNMSRFVESTLIGCLKPPTTCGYQFALIARDGIKTIDHIDIRKIPGPNPPRE